MPAIYPGRDGDYDLGGGHSCTWTAGGAALTERHWYGPRGGWHSFDIIIAGTGILAAGSPADPARLTLTIPLTCPVCGITGRITAGRWVPA